MRGVAWWCQWRTVFAPAILGALASGCVTFSDGPTRLYTVPEETQQIRDYLQRVDFVQYGSLDEIARRRFRNDLIGTRMYAIDIQYTPYEAALTKERQSVGFGAAATTIALTTAAGLVGPVATKNVLTGLAGFVTGARAAYDSDILLSHSVQWIQAQMEAKRAEISSRILRGMRLSTIDYPLAAALSDLEAYYRAGTFTGGLLSTNEVIASDAQNAAAEKAVAQGLIPVVEEPLPPKGFKPDGPKPGEVFRTQVANALCVSQTRKTTDEATKDFFLGRGLIEPTAVAPIKLDATFRTILTKAVARIPSCEKAGFRTAFEVGRYGADTTGNIKRSIDDLQGGLRKKLNLPATALPNTGVLDKDTRAAVAAFRTAKGLDKPLGGAVDNNFLLEVTKD